MGSSLLAAGSATRAAPFAARLSTPPAAAVALPHAGGSATPGGPFALAVPQAAPHFTGQIPVWLQGQHLTLVELMAGAVGEDGSLIPSSTVFRVTTSVFAIRFTSVTQHADVRPLNSRRINNVIIGDGMACRMVELLKSNESFLRNTIPYLAYYSDYVYVSMSRGPNAWAHWFVRGPFTDGVDNHAGNTCEWDLLPCDPGVPPQYLDL